jgi:hypothetical protein
LHVGSKALIHIAVALSDSEYEDLVITLSFNFAELLAGPIPNARFPGLKGSKTEIYLLL